MTALGRPGRRTRGVARWAFPVLVGAGLVVGLRALTGGDSPAPPPRTDAAPWGLPDEEGRRIAAAKLPPYRENADATHIHAHLDVLVDGQRIEIPAGLGLRPPYSAVHTHSDSGLLHVETDDPAATVTLGQFFTVWGVRLTGDCLGAYCGPRMAPRLYVNGARHAGSPGDAAITDGAQFTLVVGEEPTIVPSAYDCRNAADIEVESCRRSFL